MFDFDDSYYDYILKQSVATRNELEKSQNHTMSQHKAFEFENFLLKLSNIHSLSKSILAGHINYVEKDNLIAISRNISTESNFLFLFNTNSNNSVSIDKCTTYIRIQNAKSKVEYSNTGDFSGDILFNDKNSPIIETNLCPYCSIIISWAFKPLDIEDIL
jgi:hypothetical protein